MPRKSNAGLTCIKDDCDKSVRARGMCENHYRKDKRYGKFGGNACSVEDCSIPVHGRGLCASHYNQMRASGQTGSPICSDADCSFISFAKGSCRRHYQIRRNAGEFDSGDCTKAGCERVVKARGLCRVHYYKEFESTAGERVPAPPRIDSNGYVRISVNGQRVHEHRVVMEGLLGRRLVSGENVHHINGDRSDNRPENLEIWNTYQPSGQRAQDKVEWAVEMLKLYKPEMLAI